MQETSSSKSLDEIIIDLKAAFKYLISKTIAILLFAILFSIFGFVLSWYKGPSYKATLNFVSENSNSDGLSGYAGIASQFGIDLGGRGGGGAFEGDNLIEVLKSRRLIVSTLLSPINNNDTTKLLIHLFIENHFKGKGLDSIKLLNFVTNKGVPNRQIDSVLNSISNQISKGKLLIEKKDKKLNFILLSFEDNNELFAKLFVEKLAANAINFFTEYKTKKTTNNLRLLQNQCDSLRQVLHESLNGAAEVSDLNINPLKQIVRSDLQKKQVDVQTSTVMYTELLKQFALAKVQFKKKLH